MKKIALLFIFAALPSIANANLLVNGSFEANIIPHGTWTTLSNLTGWTGGQNQIELRNNVAGTASDGVNYVELDTYANSSVYQNVVTTAKQIYDLQFDYSPRMGFPASTNPIQVSWDNTLLSTVTGNGYNIINKVKVNNLDNYWYTVDIKVTGTGSDVIKFAAAGTSDGVGGSLDNVILTAVPEPEIYAMMFVGLGLIGFAARCRSAD